MVVYEPVLFSVLMANAPQSDAAREIVGVRDDTIRLVDEGDLNAAAERFVDYWTGDGAWAAIPESRRPAIAEAIRAAKPEWDALFHDSTPLGAFAEIDVPTLFLTGTSSKASALGHMAPVTQPERINPLIERFLEATQLALAGAASNSARTLGGL